MNAIISEVCEAISARKKAKYHEYKQSTASYI